ncbi:putative duf1620 domain-containing protein [Rosellinia necatrix]|uniref:Putative duf1620 domain-containing protein n=1 Tax=Rosellinia necatrix TaxID=77044 RepID=A0A1S7ULC5_ROSNE|nr:putative duf1620 domain-containing protein [Rosellinia necatrix]
MSRLLAAAILVAAVRGLAFDGKPARATAVVAPNPTFHFPTITQAPSLRELFKRDTGDQTVLIGPDNTCGYIDGRPGAPLTCNNQYTCAIVIQESYGRAGCCQGEDCGLRATCYDSQQVYASSYCNDACLQDTFTLKCTENTARFCNTATFFSGVIDYWCGPNQISTPQQISTTWNGQTDAVSWQEFIFTASGSDTGFESATDDGSFSFSFTSEPSSTTSIVTGGSGNSGGNNGGSSNNNNNGGSSNGDTPTEKKSSTPIGAIVGGVVGGVAVIALIGLGIFFILRHNKKKNPPVNPEQSMQQAAAAGGTAPPATGAPGYPPQAYNNANYGQQGYQQPPTSPQTYFPQEQKPAGFVGIAPTVVPDRHDSTSPISQFSDPRHSTQPPHSPTSTLNAANWTPQPVQPVSPGVPPNVHEAGGNIVGARDYNANHRGQFHEMA